jgi:hypothetical protein
MRTFWIIFIFLFQVSASEAQNKCLLIIGNLERIKKNSFELTSGQNRYEIFLHNEKFPAYSKDITLRVRAEWIDGQLVSALNQIDMERRYVASSNGYLKEINIKKGAKCL